MVKDAGIWGLSYEELMSMIHEGDIKSILLKGDFEEIMRQVDSKYMESMLFVQDMSPVTVRLDTSMRKLHGDILIFSESRVFIFCSNDNFHPMGTETFDAGVKLIRNQLASTASLNISEKEKVMQGILVVGKSSIDIGFMNWLDENPLEVK